MQSVADQEARQLRLNQVREKLWAFYGKVKNKAKQTESAITALVEAYNGRWDDLNKAMKQKYGVSPDL